MRFDPKETMPDEYGRRKPHPYAIDGHTNVQMQQIANVFYNLLNLVGTQNQDKRMLQLSSSLRDQI